MPLEQSPFIHRIEGMDELIAAIDRLTHAVANALSEQEWQTIINKPHVQIALKRMAEEAERQYASGETEEGGFAVEEELSEKYELGKTGMHTIDQLRRHIQIFLEQDHLDASTWQHVILMELLLHMYDKLNDIEGSVSTMSDDSWNDHHER